MLLASYPKRLAAIQKYAAQSEENARQAEHDIFGIQNSFKAVTGYEGGLKDPADHGQEEPPKRRT